MKIRLSEVGDIPAILCLLGQVGKVHHLVRPDIVRENACKYSASQLISLLEHPNWQIFVAEKMGNVIGYCICVVRQHKDDPVVYDRLELYIDDLCVDNTYRGQHVGAALYAAAREYAQSRNCYHITLNVWKGNDAAYAFYQRCGLKPWKVEMEAILEDTDAGKE